jgi:hypothetical protein
VGDGSSRSAGSIGALTEVNTFKLIYPVAGALKTSGMVARFDPQDSHEFAGQLGIIKCLMVLAEHSHFPDSHARPTIRDPLGGRYVNRERNPVLAHGVYTYRVPMHGANSRESRHWVIMAYPLVRLGHDAAFLLQGGHDLAEGSGREVTRLEERRVGDTWASLDLP